MGQHKHKAWDRRCWVVAPPEGEAFTIETTESSTWALRALRAAGMEGLHPTDGASGRFAMLIAKLRDLGIQIEDLQADDETGRPGFLLVSKVAPIEVTR
jgi:hypothetical protein